MRYCAMKISTRVSRAYRYILNSISPPLFGNHFGDADILWARIFRKEDWIKQACECNANPVLIGPYLSSMRRYATGEQSTPHRVLILVNYRSQDGACSTELFFDSLRHEYVYDKTNKVVILPAYKLRARGASLTVPPIILYISDILTGNVELPTDSLRHLFERDRMQTQYTFALDRKTHTLYSTGVRGPCGLLRDDSKHIPICTIKLLEGSHFMLRESYCPPMDITPGDKQM